MNKIRINKNRHYRNLVSTIMPRVKLAKRMETEYYVQFEDSCKYELETNKTQVNKLLGIGHLHHHLNSVRLGWRYNKTTDNIELLPYYYENGERIILKSKPFYVLTGETFKVKFLYVYNTELNYIQTSIYINDELIDIQLWFNNSSYIKQIPIIYECFPYFGGSVKSPHDMVINIDRAL